MTTHDDPDVQLLERDLRRLADARPEDRVLQLALREQLDARLQARPAPRPRRRRRAAMRWALGSATAAAGAIAVLVFVAASGPGGPSVADAAILRHALTAVTWPANSILHEKVVGVQNGAPVAAEFWQQTSPPYASRAMKGTPGHQGEFADDGTTSYAYDPSTNTIYEQADTARPTFTDPVSQIRQELADGQAQVAGTVVIAGLSLYKIDLPHGMVGYFDQSDYRPRYLDDPQRGGSVVRLRVVAYGYLPMTPANRAALSVTTQHPGARLDTNPAEWPGK